MKTTAVLYIIEGRVCKYIFTMFSWLISSTPVFEMISFFRKWCKEASFSRLFAFTLALSHYTLANTAIRRKWPGWHLLAPGRVPALMILIPSVIDHDLLSLNQIKVLIYDHISFHPGGQSHVFIIAWIFCPVPQSSQFTSHYLSSLNEDIFQEKL